MTCEWPPKSYPRAARDHVIQRALRTNIRTAFSTFCSPTLKPQPQFLKVIAGQAWRVIHETLRQRCKRLGEKQLRPSCPKHRAHRNPQRPRGNMGKHAQFPRLRSLKLRSSVPEGRQRSSPDRQVPSGRGFRASGMPKPRQGRHRCAGPFQRRPSRAGGHIFSDFPGLTPGARRCRRDAAFKKRNIKTCASGYE